jgi:serine/threonine protein kinase
MPTCIFSNCPAPEAGPDGRCSGCGSLLSGERVRDRYVVREVMNRSKYSVTYLSIDLKTGEEQRVLKELLHVAEDDPEFYSTTRAVAERLFEREARVLLTLQHRGVPRLFTTFEEKGYWYLVQEYIPGETLLEWLETNQTIIDARELSHIYYSLVGF